MHGSTAVAHFSPSLPAWALSVASNSKMGWSKTCSQKIFVSPPVVHEFSWVRTDKQITLLQMIPQVGSKFLRLQGAIISSHL